MLKYFYMTNNPNIGKIIEKSGIDRVWIDLEVIGKAERQANVDTVKSNHKIEDIGKMKRALKQSEVIVRVNPIHEKSAVEIDQVISQGADIVMLPYFKTVRECEMFLDMVNGRARTCLLIETKEAEALADKIGALEGADEIHIGLNDLYLSHGKKFLYEMIAYGNVERLAAVLRKTDKTWGFGGFGKLYTGKLPARYILDEHYRVGSQVSILGRSFCDLRTITDLKEIEKVCREGMEQIKEYEEKLTKLVEDGNTEYFEESRRELKRIVAEIVASM